MDAEPLQGTQQHDHPHAIYAPGTSAKYISQHPDAFFPAPDGNLPAFQIFNRWSSTATDGSGLTQGDPTTLTWSIVPDGLSIPGSGGEPTSGSDLIAFLGDLYGVNTDDTIYTDEPWFNLFQSSLQRWSELSGLTFVYEADDGAPFSFSPGVLGSRGDIRISGHPVDGNSNVLAYNFFPNGGDMVIDTNDNFYNVVGNNSIRLRNVLMHEHGHGLGLDHVCPAIGGADGRLMEPFLNTSIDGPQFDDILAMQRSYGDALEKDGGNDTDDQATDLGVLADGQTILLGTDAIDNRVSPDETDFVSIDDNFDTDYFSFTVGDGTEVDILLTPRGPTYLSGSQNSNGSCSAGSEFNASEQSDLTLELVAPDGSSLVSTSNSTGLGGIESITTEALDAGTYFVRVSGANNAAQMYELELQGVQQLGVIVDEADGLRVAEGGFTDSYQLGLATSPTGSVEITIQADDQSELSVDGVEYSNSLIVEFADDSSRSIFVRAGQDLAIEGLHTSTITHNISSTQDPSNYPTSLPVRDAMLQILDDEMSSFERISPRGTLVGLSQDNIGSIVESDGAFEFAGSFEAGEQISLVASPDSAAVLTLEISDLAGPTSAAGPGQSASLEGIIIPESGEYRFRIAADIATDFELEAVLNAVLELSDSSDGSEKSLASSALSLSSTAKRYAAIGRSEATTAELTFESYNDPSRFVDISSSGTALNLGDDDLSFVTSSVGNEAFPAGEIAISNNGVVLSGDGVVNFVNAPLPTTDFIQALVPFWDDLDGSAGNVFWQERQVDGIETLIVQWEDRPQFSGIGNVTFQVQVFAEGPIFARYVYQDVSFDNPQFDFGVSATVGYQADNFTALQFGFNEAVLSNGQVLDLTIPTIPDVDEFEIDLSEQEGEQIDVVLSGIEADFDKQLVELLSPAGDVLATAVADPLLSETNAGNLDLAIVNFTVPDVGVYTIRVTSDIGGRYSLLLTDRVVMEVESNDQASDPLRDVSLTKAAIGWLDANADADDFYDLSVTEGELVTIFTRTPFDSSGSASVNTLDPELQVFQPDGSTLVTSDTDAVDGKNAGVSFVAPSSGTFKLKISATAGVGEYFLAYGDASLATDNLVLNGTGWQPIFRDFIDGGFNDGPSGGVDDDSIAEGYRLPLGTAKSVPWVGIDQLKIPFSADVAKSLDVEDFILTGQFGFDSNFAPGVVPVVTGVLWDPETSSAVVQLSQALEPNRFELTALAAGIVTADGQTLNGDQSWRIYVLPGDAVDAHEQASDGSYQVNAQDATFIRDRFTGFIYDEPGNNSFDDAYFNYDLRADINGDGFVNAADATLIRDSFTSFIFEFSPFTGFMSEAKNERLLSTRGGTALPRNTQFQAQEMRMSRKVERQLVSEPWLSNAKVIMAIEEDDFEEGDDSLHLLAIDVFQAEQGFGKYRSR